MDRRKGRSGRLADVPGLELPDEITDLRVALKLTVIDRPDLAAEIERRTPGRRFDDSRGTTPDPLDQSFADLADRHLLSHEGGSDLLPEAVREFVVEHLADQVCLDVAEICDGSAGTMWLQLRAQGPAQGFNTRL